MSGVSVTVVPRAFEFAHDRLGDVAALRRQTVRIEDDLGSRVGAGGFLALQ